MSKYHHAINRHYGNVDLRTRILDRLRRAGKNPRVLTRDDLASFDEFHSGGRTSTRELARLARIKPGVQILDVGCGIGGPARTLAAEFDSFVVALDLTEEFCQAAAMLTALVDLSDRVVFQQGDAVALPFRDRQFDVVWSQNTIMNIPDKAKLFREVHRVLHPGGRFAFESILSGTATGIHYPTFWASSAETDFLPGPGETRELLGSIGFEEEVWEDNTATTLEQARQRQASLRGEEMPGLGREVIVVDDIERKMENSIRNAEENRTVMIRAVFRRRQ